MIEFQADCGHTIQTDDRNAGQVVKCAYCGREVEAPRPEEEERDLLFQEVDLSELAKDASGTAIAKAITIKGKQKKGKGPPRKEDLGPAPTGPLRRVLIMCYVTIGLVVVFFVGRAVVNFASQQSALQPDDKMASRAKPIHLDELPDVTDLLPDGPTSVNILDSTEQESVTASTDLRNRVSPADEEEVDRWGEEDDEDQPKRKSLGPRRSGKNPWERGKARGGSEVTEEDTDERDKDGEQPSRRSRRNPWQRRQGRSSAGAAEQDASEDLGAVTRDFAERLRRGRSVDADQWKSYLVGGKYHTLWQTAGIRERVTFIELLDIDIVEELIDVIGDTMLSDPDLDVRLAMLEALVSTNSTHVIPYIDRRLEAIEQDEDMNPDEANREKKALRNARNKLSQAGKDKKRNPWKR